MFRLPVLVVTCVGHSITDFLALCKFPFLHAGTVYPLRWTRSAVRWGAWVLLTALFLTSAGGVAAQPVPPGDLVPANATLFVGPRARTPARLEALRVEATIQPENERTWAAVQAWFRLQNPLTSTLALDTIVQGVDTTPPASAVTLTVGGVPQLLELLEGNNHWRWQTELPGSGRLEPLLSYRVPLGEGALARFRYDPVSGWGRGPESVRITLRFPTRLAADQLILVRPPGYTFDGQQLTWSVDNPRQLQPVELLMVVPSAWQALQAAQSAAATPTATAADHLALGRWYHRLALADVGEDTVLFDRYYAQAMAALAQVRTLAPADPDAPRLLADLFLRQAARSGSDTTTRALAAAALADARAAGDDSPELLASLGRLYLELAHAAQAEGSWAGAAAYVEKVARLDATAISTTLQADLQAIARDVALAQAQDAVGRRDLAAARQLIESTWGSNVLAVPGAPVANFLAQQASVSLSTTQQVITLTLTPRPAQQAVALATLQRAVADAQSVPGVLATLTDEGAMLRLTLTLPFDGAARLGDVRTRLAGLVAPEPDLALLRAVLEVHNLDTTTTTDLLRQTQQLTDTLDLPMAHQIWTDQGERYRRAIDDLSTKAGDDAEAGLAPIQRALWHVEAGAWRDLAGNSEVRYQATLTTTTGLARTQTWISGLATPLVAQLSVSDFRWELLLVTGAVLLLLVVIAAWLFWRFV